jgi:hypothetical protein
LGLFFSTLQIHKVEKQAANPGDKPKTWISYELTDYNWMSYRKAKTYADRVGLGIKGLGVNKGDFVMIFASTWYVPFASSRYLSLACSNTDRRQRGIDCLFWKKEIQLGCRMC